MPRGRKQLTLIDDKLDPPVVQAADRVIELMKEKKSVKEKLDIQQRNLIGLLNQAGKAKIRHGGFLISVSVTPGKEKISLRELKNAGK
jgi:hypothetical protein